MPVSVLRTHSGKSQINHLGKWYSGSRYIKLWHLIFEHCRQLWKVEFEWLQPEMKQLVSNIRYILVRLCSVIQLHISLKSVVIAYLLHPTGSTEALINAAGNVLKCIISFRIAEIHLNQRRERHRDC